MKFWKYSDIQISQGDLEGAQGVFQRIKSFSFYQIGSSSVAQITHPKQIKHLGFHRVFTRTQKAGGRGMVDREDPCRGSGAEAFGSQRKLPFR